MVRALWDTGADITVVERELVTSHPELFTAPGNADGTDSSGTTAVTEVCRMAGYRIADVPFAGHTVAVADLPEPFEMVLGYPTLCQAIWSMDLPSGRWAVSQLPVASCPAAISSDGRAPTTDCATPELSPVGPGVVPGAADPPCSPLSLP